MRRDGARRARCARHPTPLCIPARRQRAAAAARAAPRGAHLGRRHGGRAERGQLGAGGLQSRYVHPVPFARLDPPPPLLPPCHLCPQLTHWFPGGGEGGAKCVGPDSASFLRTLRAGQGWESPRPPFDVVLHATARLASTTGRQQEGEPYFSSTEGQPLACSLGAGQLPPGVEAALGAMMRGQEAVLLCPLAQLRGGSLMPDPPNADEGGGSGNSETSGTQAAPLYGEVQLQLLDFSQARRSLREAEWGWRAGLPGALCLLLLLAGSHPTGGPRSSTHPPTTLHPPPTHPPPGARHGGRRRRGQAHSAQGAGRVPH